VAELKPFPPGEYPVVVVGSGPGALQLSYSLSRLGVPHAVLSEDDAPGGMFRRFPLFQRLITWTKPYSTHERGTRAYEWHDWNSLIGDEPDHRAVLPPFMDGVSYYPSRPEMEKGLVEFATRAAIQVRYGCRWESTRHDGAEFVLGTSDGEYRCRAAVFAVGMTEPWKPPIPGLDEVEHYVDIRAARDYAGKRLFIMGKRNSGFEVADAMLPWARQIVLGSPRPARISVLVRSTAAARARYLQPYEDHVLGGGNIVLDAAIERVERTVSGGFRVFAKGTTIPGDYELDADAVIAATGFTTPLRDLPSLGVKTFYQGRLPAQTPYWESTTLPGVYFAGSITQGSIGLKKYGQPSNSAAVHGFRYNARVLARHIATSRFGVTVAQPQLKPGDVVPFLLEQASRGPELWNQQSYLTRVLTFDRSAGIFDAGVEPLAHFVDAPGPDAVAITVETSAEGEIRPAAYVRRGGRVDEHILPSNPLLDFGTKEHQDALSALLKPLID
jgi:thioredoxin reductase